MVRAWEPRAWSVFLGRISDSPESHLESEGSSNQSLSGETSHPGYLTKNADFICMNLYLVKQESLGKDSWFKNTPTDNFWGLKGKCTVLLAFKSHQGFK